jgi:hypothetical protein
MRYLPQILLTYGLMVIGGAVAFWTLNDFAAINDAAGIAHRAYLESGWRLVLQWGVIGSGALALVVGGVLEEMDYFRVVGMNHVVDVANGRALAHLARRIRCPEIADAHTLPPAMRETWD